MEQYTLQPVFTVQDERSRDLDRDDTLPGDLLHVWSVPAWAMPSSPDMLCCATHFVQKLSRAYGSIADFSL